MQQRQHQEQDVPRETFIALRARREAYQVASDMIYEERIDVRRVECSGCGQWLDVHGPTVKDPLICPACHARTPLPAYLRARYMPRHAKQSRRILEPRNPFWEWAEPIVDSAAYSPVPRWLIWFTIVLVVILIGAIAGILG